ncbi:carbohydrate-binding module family 1 protein [Periconia macrospinosa]|uniref:alpha-galactosidase n=1 Tax=Periconia macrospinosa TaxID=97972 RepID=A0A2V1ED08_9PLEO|nr:carbohydrate-binding module family 1 protein [Periconia macrospinosa]
MLCRFLWAALLANGLSSAQVQFQKGQKWQIILGGIPDMSKAPLAPLDATVWDVDLFDNDASNIKALKATGDAVVCYFSAGTVEDWRDDVKDFPSVDVGKVLPEWPNEKWIRTGSSKVREIMSKRIKLASDKGCDAIDPDNCRRRIIRLQTVRIPDIEFTLTIILDGYQNDNGLNLRNTDAIDYIRWMQKEAAKYNMQIGLKNAIDIVDALTPYIDFAVNEQCAQLMECERYAAFLATNKPVFHIEYPTPLNSSQANTTFCLGPGTLGMSTILKNLLLDGLTVYCDGSMIDTPTKGGSSPPRPTTRPPRPTRPPITTTKPPTTTPKPPTTTPKPPTTTRPTTTRPTTTRPTTTRPTTTSRPPTSTPGNPGGCRSKHWDQCGGQDWKGCTVCESPYTCKGVSPPWYYQCL